MLVLLWAPLTLVWSLLPYVGGPEVSSVPAPPLDWTLIIVGGMGMVGTFAVALCSLAAAFVAARYAKGARDAGQQAEVNSRPVSNGFAAGVLGMLGDLRRDVNTLLERSRSNTDRITVLEGGRVEQTRASDVQHDDQVLTVVHDSHPMPEPG